MKKSIILTAVLVVMTICSASAQLRYGAGLVLGTKSAINSSGNEAMGFGVNGRLYYALKAIDLSAGLTYFLPSSVSASGMDMTLSLAQINVDAHYAFSKSDKTSIYGIAGLNYSLATAETTFMGAKISADDSKVGADLGVGAKYSKLFGEVKYDTALEQIALTVGYNF